MRYAAFVFVFVLALGALEGCSGRGVNVPQPRANVSESLTLKLAPAQIPALVRAIQGDPAFDDPGISVNVSPSMGQRSATAVKASAYALALSDARAKAQAIAQRLGAGLGAATSVAELARSGMGMGYESAAASRPEKAVIVQAPGNGAIVLAVTYASSSGPISVFGIDAAAQQSEPFENATGIVLMFTARGSTLGAAAQRIRSAEAAARNVARSYGATVTLSRADFNTY